MIYAGDEEIGAIYAGSDVVDYALQDGRLIYGAEPGTVEWVWAGAVTDSTARLTAKIDGTVASLAVSESVMLTNARRIGPRFPDLFDVVSFDVDGLDPDTTYYYGVEVGGHIDPLGRGRFKTFPTTSTEIVIAVGSCSNASQGTTANKTADVIAWQRIKDRNPHLMIHLGDLGYPDNTANTVEPYLTNFDGQFGKPSMASALRGIPFAYVWDDHDYADNDSDRTATAKPAAQEAFRAFVPHYPLPSETGLIYQSFDIGPARVILTDHRSARDPHDDPQSSSKTMLGSEQKAWFKAELLDAKSEGQFVIWGSPNSWRAVSPEGWEGIDIGSWDGYQDERAELASFITSNSIDICVVTGDIHAVAIDDGTNSPAGVPEMIAAPIRSECTQLFDGAGTYSEGGLLTGGETYPTIIMQYGVVTLHANGDVSFAGYHVDTDGSETLLASLTFTP